MHYACTKNVKTWKTAVIKVLTVKTTNDREDHVSCARKNSHVRTHKQLRVQAQIIMKSKSLQRLITIAAAYKESGA